ncbi:MAG: hypothetical protein RLZZ31_1572 [Actinomycetota bacterium]
MPMKLDYMLRETTSNLGRNITIGIASVMTVAVSLALVGASLMLRSGVENATKRWQGGIEFVVFMKPDATPDQLALMQSALEDSPSIASFKYVDKDGAYKEFIELFSDTPEFADNVKAADLPTSYRVEPFDKSADAVESLAAQFGGGAGVLKTATASTTIRLIQSLSSRLTVGIFIIAAFLLGAALLLIFNTIRMAVFSRRREIEVMKLVGATNWFIRVPFMLEGLIQGLIGAIIAIGALAAIKPFFQDWLPSSNEIPLVSGFRVDTPETILIFVLMGIGGVVIGAIGAGVAVSRFLDV